MTPKGTYKRGRVWWIRYTGSDGKMHFESSGSHRARDAATLLDKRRGEVQAGTAPPKRIPDYLFSELAKRYEKWAVHQKAFDRKRYFIDALKARFGSHTLRAISAFAVEQYRSDQLSAGKKHATANRHLACLKHMYSKAVEWEMVEEAAAKRVRGVKMLKEENLQLRFLSIAESHRLVAVCDGVLRDVVICGLSTGMRREEMLSLTWSQVDLVHGLLRLEKTKSGELRMIPISNSLRDVLERRATVREGSPYVFTDGKGRRMKDLRRGFRSALKAAGIPHMRFHDLRSTFASHLVMSGVDLTTVKELLGHHDIKMTLRYAHLSPGHRRQAVDRITLVPPPATYAAAAGALPEAGADAGARRCLPVHSADYAANEETLQPGGDGAASTVL